MKRSLLVTVLALVLGVSALTVAAVRLDGTKTPVAMDVLCQRGDRAAAAGLTVLESVTFGGHARWDNAYRVATGENDASFSYRAGTAFDPPYAFTNPDGSPFDPQYPFLNAWSLTPRCLVAEEDEWYTALYDEALASGEDTVTIRLKDYFDVYPMALEYWSTDAYFFQALPHDTPLLPFDKLRIPVAEDDYLQLIVDRWGSNVLEMQIAQRVVPVALAMRSGTLTTVGFAPDAQPEADWAPEGFGLWYIPVVRQDVAFPNGSYAVSYPAAEQAELVFPLDIARQRVVRMVYGGQDDILLVVAEDDEYVLYVLDSQTFRQRQRLALGNAELIETTYQTCYRGVYSNLNSHQFTDYGGVSVHVDDGFLAAVLNSHTLTVLSPTAQGYYLDFACETATLVTDDGGTRFMTRAELEGQEVEDGYSFNLFSLTNNGSQSFPTLPMAYAGGRLAMIADALYGERAVVQVYSADGLLYAAALQPEVMAQAYSQRYSFYYADVFPSVSWDKAADE